MSRLTELLLRVEWLVNHSPGGINLDNFGSLKSVAKQRQLLLCALLMQCENKYALI